MNFYVNFGAKFGFRRFLALGKVGGKGLQDPSELRAHEGAARGKDRPKTRRGARSGNVPLAREVGGSFVDGGMSLVKRGYVPETLTRSNLFLRPASDAESHSLS